MVKLCFQNLFRSLFLRPGYFSVSYLYLCIADGTQFVHWSHSQEQCSFSLLTMYSFFLWAFYQWPGSQSFPHLSPHLHNFPLCVLCLIDCPLVWASSAWQQGYKFPQRWSFRPEVPVEFKGTVSGRVRFSLLWAEGRFGTKWEKFRLSFSLGTWVLPNPSF